MKKKLLVVFLFAMIFCLTGCGNKPSTLTCSQSVSTVDVKLNANFMGKTLQSMGLEYSMDLSSYSDSMISILEKKDFCSTVQGAMSQFTLTNCEQKIADKKMSVTAGIDISKISKSDLTGSPEATKAALEKQGYTCELKY